MLYRVPVTPWGDVTGWQSAGVSAWIGKAVRWSRMICRVEFSTVIVVAGGGVRKRAGSEQQAQSKERPAVR